MDKSLEQLELDTSDIWARYEQQLREVEELAKTDPTLACQRALSVARELKTRASAWQIMAANCYFEAEELETSEALAEAELAQQSGNKARPNRRTLRSLKVYGEGPDPGQLSRVANQMRAKDGLLPEADRRIQTLKGGTLTDAELSKVFAEMEARRHRTRGRVNKNQQTKS